MISQPNLKKVFEKFTTQGSFVKAEPYGDGHIHDTFKVSTKNDTYDYILQRLNTYVFRDIEALQQNISRVTRHLRKKLEEAGESEIDRKCLTLINTVDDNVYARDDEGSYWRMYIFISNHRSYQVVKDTLQAFQGGKAIGRFQALLADMPSPPLNETIPYFHNIENRLLLFHNALEKDIHGRAANIQEEIEFVESRQEEMKTILRLGKEGKIPLRITHNDTKFNNILLDQNDKALCVIDLDTVMPGYVHYDFGDAIRTAANSAAEDEKDLDKIFMNIELYEAYARGYLDELKEVLNPVEKEYLPYAPSLITYTIGLRFLTDHLDGDKYFKTHRKNHNLDRARTQFRLVRSNEEQIEDMKRIIADICSGTN